MVAEKIKSSEEAVSLSEIAANAGAIMLANGAEIYRVEDTVERIIRSKKSIKDVDVWCSFNVIIISFSYQGEIHSNVRRVKNRSNNLYYVDKVNTFSRNFASGQYSLYEAAVEIEKIKKSEGIPTKYKILGASLAAGAYSVLLGARIPEILASLFVGCIGYIFTLFLEDHRLNYFVVHFFYGNLVSFISLLFAQWLGISSNVVVISAMMAFVPGIMITNAVRDLLSGDTISGITAATMAILISTALALGVAIPIGIFSFLRLI